MVNWSWSSLERKSFHEHFFIFNDVLKPLFSKLTLFWPGGWNKKRVNGKNNIESKFIYRASLSAERTRLDLCKPRTNSSWRRQMFTLGLSMLVG